MSGYGMGIESPLLDPDYPRDTRPVRGYCRNCGEALHEGDRIIESDDKELFCENCVYDMTAAELLDLVGKTWQTL